MAAATEEGIPSGKEAVAEESAAVALTPLQEMLHAFRDRANLGGDARASFRTPEVVKQSVKLQILWIVLVLLGDHPILVLAGLVVTGLQVNRFLLWAAQSIMGLF